MLFYEDHGSQVDGTINSSPSKQIKNDAGFKLDMCALISLPLTK